MMQDESDYYSQHLPQSEYRITKSTGRRAPVYIQLGLEKLPRCKKADKVILRERITQQMTHLIDTLIGEIEVDPEWQDKTLHQIYAQLGI